MKIKQIIKKFNKYYSYASITNLFRKKIKNTIKDTSPEKLTQGQKNEINKFYSNLGIKNIKYDWHQFYLSMNKFFDSDLNENFDTKYIPEDIYYAKIEPIFNRKGMFPALLDKNLLSNLFYEIKQPVTIIKNINGFYYSNTNKLIQLHEAIEICLEHNQIVIKPSIDSGGGKNISLFKVNPEDESSIEKLFNSYKKDFIIQEVVNQNAQMKLLNPSSLNTIRVFSYLRGVEVIILSTFVRVGGKNQFADNVTGGGISCGIDNNGRLKKYGGNYNYSKFTKTDNGCEFENFEIPFFNEILIMAKKLHKKTPNFKLISWDLAVDETDSIVLIEYNTFMQEINAHQIYNGPLFGEYTEEILKEISK